MYKRSLMFTALALGILCRCAPAFAADEPNDSHLGAGIHDVTDPELADMRGRYVAGNDVVLYFGVEMISTWQTNSGQTLQGTLTIGMNFTKNPNSPQVTFVPTVTITTPNDPLPTTSTVQSTISRNAQSGGIANVGGLVQSVQIAGDNDATANVTKLNIQSGGTLPSTSTSSSSTTSITPPASTASSNNSGSSNTSLAANTSTSSSPSVANASVSTSGPMANTNSSTTTYTPNNSSNGSNSNYSGGNTDGVASTNTNSVPGSSTSTGSSTPTGRSATVGGVTVTSTYSNSSAQVTTSVAGEGSTSQWIHPGSLGQTIQLTTDNSVVTNQMIVNLVTQQLSGTEQLAHTLAQSLNLSHINGH